MRTWDELRRANDAWKRRATFVYIYSLLTKWKLSEIDICKGKVLDSFKLTTLHTYFGGFSIEKVSGILGALFTPSRTY